MELDEFLTRELTVQGSRIQRWPIAFKISFSRMVVHLYESIKLNAARETPVLVKAFDLNPVTFKFDYEPRHHLADLFPDLLTETKLEELGHPDFQQNFCDRMGTVRQQVWIWNCDFSFGNLNCIKLIKVRNVSLLSEFNFEFHLVVNQIQQ